ncbi:MULTISPECIES: NAD-dependent epimerase/dehydratase family protein [unclassified Janthinobacterium]|uniref:NAD-dependent epimerase/dehydratase family protein n=1 Tax=unclassified Janthinobacterium TaxID=2610881 RepID=UPI0009DA10CF|nr:MULTISPECIES: NAD-dependent epimerase/dehydratase family protein [unclassified Janthinobacterium]MEC5163429.1 nucleoside-diphosphate-sugar epimerase [Janthinobacterium sp. CG_S6]
MTDTTGGRAAAGYRPGVSPADVGLMLTHTPAAVWEALRGQRIFVTGGTGFVGCWLLEALLAGHERFQLGLELTVLTRAPERFRAKAPHLAGHPALRLMAGDATDLAGVDGRFDTILHLATDVVSPGADPLRVYRDIVGGAEQTLALAARAGSARYLLTSSGAVYGRQPGDCPLVPEQHTGAPATTDLQSAYGQAKRSAEFLLACHAGEHGTQARIARCFTLVGPYMALDAQFAIGNFIRDSLAGGPVRVGGDGTPLRSYLYAADMAVWLLTILINGDAQPYNVGSSQAISVAELARHVSRTLRGAEDVVIARAAASGPAPARYVPSTARAASLGLREYTDLSAAIRATAAWHTQPPAR